MMEHIQMLVQQVAQVALLGMLVKMELKLNVAQEHLLQQVHQNALLALAININQMPVKAVV